MVETGKEYIRFQIFKKKYCIMQPQISARKFYFFTTNILLALASIEANSFLLLTYFLGIDI